MAERPSKQSSSFPKHGSMCLPLAEVLSYNLEIEEGDGFIGDQASKSALLDIIQGLRDLLPENADPLGDDPMEEFGKDRLDTLLTEGDFAAAGLLHAAIEEFSGRLEKIIRRFLRLKAWRETERIVIGGGVRQSRMGQIAIGRTATLLRKGGIDIRPVRHHPDEAGLIGAVHLAPSWIFAGHDSILALDIGGSNIRAGVVRLDIGKHPDLTGVEVWQSELWSHSDEDPKRDEAVDRTAEMLQRLLRKADKEGLHLAPFIGVGCPGVIGEDGSIDRGAQNLPGNWESKGFNLPDELRDRVPRIGDHETLVLVHNDAVVQGLSEAPFCRDVGHWAALTIGTGLGNASYATRDAEDE
ncbi:hypothetical protein SAMN05216548_102176 [Faunimonas pinastri]|uniref:Glucokinase n=1 Tax=Faunimonas pinastri TaxID=1855383 RepID=A0A1H9CLX5_9HYPH|nr:ROK family protein [Faunimonas pinastri]SEQ01618.1 hypothetical protein SAMN05216548_102176 [Faunimonas pinastri]